MATLTGEITKVRLLLDQNSNTDTQYSDTMIGNLLNQGRRMFARLLPEDMIPNLKTTASLTLTSGYSAFSSNFLRHVADPEVKVDSVVARPIPIGERWRLKFLSGNDLIKGSSSDKYYYFDDSGVNVLPTTATAISFPYIKKPTDLSGTSSVELPEDIDDMVVDWAFEKCAGTSRGDMELAVYLARQRGIILQGAQV